MSATSESVGGLLRRERERQGLTVQKVADELRLDKDVVESIEADAYESRVPPVYARGHIRTYSRLLGVPFDEGTSAPPAGPAEGTVQAAAPRRHPPRPMRIAPRVRKLPWPQLGVLAAIVVVLLLFWWSPWKHQVAVQAAVVHAVPSAASAAEEAPAEAPGGLINASALGDPEPVPATPVPATPAPATPAPAAPAPAGPARRPAGASAVVPAAAVAEAASDATAPGRIRLRLTFSASSWVDVRDASGRQLFVGHGRANTVRVLAGRAPLRVRLGYAGGVRVAVNDHEVPIERNLLKGEVARFQAGADGLLHPLSASSPARG